MSNEITKIHFSHYYIFVKRPLEATWKPKSVKLNLCDDTSVIQHDLGIIGKLYET